MSVTCHLIGTTRLLTRCGDALVDAGVDVRGVFSDDPVVTAWATGRGLPLQDPAGDLAATLAADPPDYLFSMVNFRILPAEVLALPTVAAINFHDGPLPRYAGSHVPAWALFEGAPRHAATWHVMTPRVDAGPVLAERWFPVRSHSTGLSLTWETAEAGIELFGELVPDLARGVLPEPVDTAGRERRFYRRAARMDDGVVHPGTPADRAERLGKAMDFGTFPNPLGLPAVVTGRGAVLCRQLRAVPRAETRAGSVVAAVHGSTITVSTPDADLVLADFVAVDGSTLSGTAAAQRLGAVPGSPLPPVTDTGIATIGAELDALRRHEPWWRERLADVAPLAVPARDFSAVDAHYARHALAFRPAAAEETAVLEQAFLRVLARRTGADVFDVAWSTSAMLARQVATRELASPRVPVRFDAGDPAAFAAACDEASARAGFAADLEIRAGLAPRPWGSDVPSFTRVALLRRAPGEDCSIDPDTEAALVSVDGAAPLVCVRATWLDDGTALDLAEEVEEEALRALLHGTSTGPERTAPEPGAAEAPDTAPEPRADGPRTVLELFDAAVAAHPAAPAVRSGATNLDYTALDRWADTVAAALYDTGVGPGSVVGVLTERGPELLPAMLGVLRCGAAFLPLDPGFPRERLERYVDVARAELVLTDAATLELGRSLGEARTVPGDDGRALAVPPVVDAGELAYVLFTSGSTGEPKGVEIGHAALGNFLTGIGEVLGCAAGDRVLAHTTTAFDISLLELLLPLTVGGCVLLASRAESRDQARMATLTAEADLAQATPSLWRLMLDTGWTPHPGLTVLSGGEALPPSVARRLLTGEGALWNLYGPTEATIWVSCERVREVGAFVPLGSPLPGLELHVLDDDLEPVGPGGTGQLYLSGVGLARGYANRPARTAEVFGTHPRTGVRHYRTGDLVRRHPDGALEWLGRADAQVKIRGHRVEPGEIEAVLERQPGVTAAVVVARSFEGRGEPQLTAYLTCSTPPDRERLEAPLRRELPGYMVPAAYVVLEELPLTGNGKIDRARLPEPTRDTVLRTETEEETADEATERTTDAEPDTAADAGAGAAPVVDPVDPVDPVELVGRVLGDALGLAPLRPRDRFFDLGGDSVTVVTAAAALTRELGREVGPTDVLASGTPDRLVALLGLAVADGAAGTATGTRAGTAITPAADTTAAAGVVAGTTGATTVAGTAPVPARTPDDRTDDRTTGSTTNDAIPSGDAIAVIGMACRFPGAATPDEFWAALVDGRVSIGPAPAGHRGWESLWSDADETRAGWLDGVELFDAARFGLPDREARRTDPLQRLLLTVTAEAVESAGHDPASLGSRTGVFVGTITSDFGELVAAADGHSDPHAATGSAMSLLANRLSHVFDWTGPSVALDTACSSSLVALHQAVLQLRAREADAAVVAAANLILTPSKSRSFARNGMLSPGGTCRAFDEGADGYVRGEGAAALVLRRLDDARRDGDPVLAVIRGVAVNHTGASTGFLTAPSGRAQTSVVRSALDAAGVPPSGVGYVEAHGTGTRLGDLVELEALRDALAPAAPGAVPVGSVKSNVGHLEPAAGLAGLIKAILALQAGCIPGTAGLEVPNSRFRFESSPLFVPGRPVPWDGPRVAGVSSFGFGGVNAHAVLAAAPGTAPAAHAGPQLLVLSAGSERALHLLVERLLLLLRSPHCPPLGPLCATARRRRPLAHRFACIADSVEQLEDKLMLFLAGSRGSRSSHTGTVPTDAPAAPAVMVRDGGREALDDAARRFVAGAALPADGDPAAAVRLPTVPLEERRLWLDPPAPPRAAGTARPGPEPGVGGGPTSGGARERGWTELPEAEGHAVLGERILPAAAYPQKVAELHGSYPFALQDITFRAVVRPPTTLRGRLSDGGVQFRDGSGALVCDARLLDTMPPAGDVPAAPEGVPSDVAALYRDLARHGLGYGDRFRCVRSLVTGNGVATGELEASGDHGGLDHHLIDGALQVALAACGVRGLYVPFSVHRLAVHGPLPRRVRVHARRLDRGDDGARLATADVTVTDGETVLLRAERVTWTRLETAKPAPTGASGGHTTAFATGPPAAPNGRTGPAGTTATAAPAASAGSSAPAAGAERPADGSAAGGDLTDAVTSWIADALEVDAAAIEPDRPLQELGLDSMLAVSVAQDLRDRLGVDVPVTFVLEVGTLDGLVRELRDVYGVTRPPASGTTGTTDPAAWPAEPVTAPSGTSGPRGPVSEDPAPEPAHLATAALAAVPPEPAPQASPQTRPGTAPAAPGGTGRAGSASAADPAPARPPHHEIAVVGLDGVFPGAADVDELWRVVLEGRDCLVEVPADRWNLDEYWSAEPSPGTVYLRRAGFVDDLEAFDAPFFRIAPNDARWIDPQQRHLVQSAWRALEDAGLSGRTGDRTVGVYVGASYQHYRDQVVGDVVQTAAGLGNHNAILANRVSWFLDLRGPSMTIDTLCSSSLVALHTAVRSLREGECDTALVAGVHLALSPQYFQLGSRLRSFSPTGESRAFDAGADGFVPGEGVVTVVLKPLAAALTDGDRIHAVVTGTAVNHGGRASGLTVPTTNAQRDVVAGALRDAGVAPDTIGYVEAHGTGTSLGDPIEIDGLTRAWREHTDRNQYCAIGSLKTNIGHLEPAAGLAGLVKIILALRHHTLPPTRNLDRPNDHIHFENTPFYPLLTPTPWPRNGTPRRAALSAFGMGGVNAHVVVEEAPPRAVPDPARSADGAGTGSHLLRVTAATEDGLRAVAGAYARHLRDHPGDRLDDVARTAHLERVGQRLRVLLHARDRAEMLDELDALAAGTGIEPATAGRRGQPVTFAFTGQGSQWAGLARELRRAEPVCAAVLDECAAHLRGHLAVPVETVLDDDPLETTDRAQVAIVATQVALVTLLGEWGVRAGAVVGHSVGELTAAWAAGVLDLPDLLRTTALRGRLMAAAPGSGAMAVVRAGVAETRVAIAATPGLEIAADNGPNATTVSGPSAAVAAFLAATPLRATPLPVAHAFHSAAMAEVAGPLAEHLAGVDLQPPSIPFASTLTGRLHTAQTATDPASYAGAVRAAVLFGPAAAQLDARVPADRSHTWWEIGPQPALLPLLRRIADPREGRTRFRATLRRGEGVAPLHRALADHHNETTTEMDLAAHHRDKPHASVPIPTYPFARTRLSALPGAVPTAADVVRHPFLDGSSGGLAS